MRDVNFPPPGLKIYLLAGAIAMPWVIPLTICLIVFGVCLVLLITWFFRKFVSDMDEDDTPDTFILIHTAKFEDYDYFDNITDV